jgi:lysophospholipase L1-like esterase
MCGITTNIIGGLLAAGAIVEIASRIYYKQKFKIPWGSKLIGEYPFDKFVEKVPAPLHFKFKPGYRSKVVNINRFGMRGKEPAPNGKKKRILLIGESLFFGSKLRKEKDLWSYQLEEILKDEGYNDWEVLNAGFPGYNVVQFYTWWKETLIYTKPDIIIFEMGANDITQAYLFGENWKPGLPWPWEFIMKQQRKSKWWQKSLFYSCFYFLLRRKKLTERKGFESKENVFKYEDCKNIITEYSKKIIEDAKKNNIKVILSTIAMAYNKEDIEKSSPQLDSIQSNWKESYLTTGKKMIEYFLWYVSDFAKEMSCDSINLQNYFWGHPERYEMYLDVAHWNEKGHRLVAETIFKKLKGLNYI